MIFQVGKTRDGRYEFSIWDGDTMLAASAGLETRAEALAALEAIRRGAPEADVVCDTVFEVVDDVG